jgi:malonyl-CoA O-methyltransferase
MIDDKTAAPILEPVAAYARWAPTYPARAHNPLMKAEEGAMLALLPKDLAGSSVIDAGCGSGRYMVHALRRGARRLVGVDLSGEMLARATAELTAEHRATASSQSGVELESLHIQLIRAQVQALPLRGEWADLTICGLTLGHLPSLNSSLAELKRVTHPGGVILCSDFHPAGHALGWRREFKADGQRCAVRHTPHSLADWERTCERLGLRIVRVLEPRLDPADIPADASFDPAALEIPVAIVFELSRIAIGASAAGPTR